MNHHRVINNSADFHTFSQTRDGPVQFEKDTTDPFGIDSMIADVTGGAGQKRYGIQEVEREDGRSKRARTDD
jgi:SNW domain-containing protein 1